MRLSYKIVVSVMCITLLSVTCDPALYPHSKYRYPLAYRSFSPLDMYPAPSMQHRMYHFDGPQSYVEEPRNTANLTSKFSDFLVDINDQDNNQVEARTADFRPEFTSYFPNLRVSNTYKPIKNIISEHNEEEASVHDYPTSTMAAPVENKGISVSFLKPDWSSITKPVANTSMDKWSGLLQLILSFITGSKSGSLEFKGFKDIIINGLLKPILVAKGNIKSFISKITIPLLSLLLINVEILVTVWWLWEDCPKEMKLESTDSKTPNNYTST